MCMVKRMDPMATSDRVHTMSRMGSAFASPLTQCVTLMHALMLMEIQTLRVNKALP